MIRWSFVNAFAFAVGFGVTLALGCGPNVKVPPQPPTVEPCVAPGNPCTFGDATGICLNGECKSCPSQAMIDACDGVEKYGACGPESPWEGVCIGGWCHCIADGQCAKFGLPCIGATCMPAACSECVGKPDGLSCDIPMQGACFGEVCAPGE